MDNMADVPAATTLEGYKKAGNWALNPIVGKAFVCPRDFP